MISNLELILRCKAIAKSKTLYVMGGFGQYLNATNKTRFISGYVYNQRADRREMIKNAKEDTLAFDCSGLIKSILWGFPIVKYGDAFKDMNANEMQKHFIQYGSWDFTGIVPGAIVWMPGHVGVYIGDGECIECTPKWKNGVQKADFKQRGWKCWFKLEGFVDYTEGDNKYYIDIKKGDTLTKIAKRFKTTIEELLELNPQIKDPDKIKAGERLRVK